MTPATTPQVHLMRGDNKELLRAMPDSCIDTIITDPPYGLSFMGKKWDYDVPSVDIWKECLRILKPGGTALVFAGSRTQHRMAVNVEDAGFELKDTIMWLYGSGFPKATDISKQLDKGVERKIIGVNPNCRPNCAGQQTRSMVAPITVQPITAPTTPEAIQWNGWKSHGLKPAYEPIIVAMKPNEGSYAANALKHGVAGLNIDGARIDYKSEKDKKEGQSSRLSLADKSTNQCAMGSLDRSDRSEISGRFPANIILDEEAAVMLDEQTGVLKSGAMDSVTKGLFPETFNTYGKQYVRRVTAKGDSGGASRFFYCAKASKAERNAGCEQLEIKQTIGGGGTNNTEDDVCGKYGSIKSAGHNFHPTVKPLALMEYLAKLTMTPSGGVVLDPYAGSGTTGVACINTGRECLLMEKEAEYWPIIESRIAAALAAAGKNK